MMDQKSASRFERRQRKVMWQVELAMGRDPALFFPSSSTQSDSDWMGLGPKAIDLIDLGIEEDIFVLFIAFSSALGNLRRPTPPHSTP
jgi:hypothetical protein